MIDLSPRSYLAHRLAVGEPRPIIDVGAADGDFSSAMRTLRPASPLVLIEPDPDAIARLHARFGSEQDATVIAAALSDEEGTGTLNRYPEGTQNSLLNQRSGGAIGAVPVQVTTLDAIMAQNAQFAGPELIKTDTQGRDLQVLRGALGTIRRYRPLVQVEVIFADLYEGQCSPAEIFALMAAEGYYLADFAMAHVDADGRLAYADWLFTPDPPVPCPNQFACRDPILLAEQASIYERAATERLALIEQLDQECRKRQSVIDELALRVPHES